MPLFKSYFDFLKEFNREYSLTALAILQLCRENSTYASPLSTLVHHALMLSKGNKTSSLKDFALTIVSHYNNENEVILQESLFTDCIHFNYHTYRVFPGQYVHLFNDITRICVILNRKGYVSSKIKYAEFCLNLSDEIANRLWYGRYETGNPEADSLYAPEEINLSYYQNAIVFDRNELDCIAEKLKCGKSCIEQLVYVHNHKALSDYNNDVINESPIESRPLYKLSNGKFLVLQPSALLVKAYLLMISAFEDFGGDSQYMYQVSSLLDILDTLLLRQSEPITRDKTYDEQGLLFKADTDKLLYFISISSYKSWGVYEEIQEIQSEQLKEKYPNSKCYFIYFVCIPGLEEIIPASWINDTIIMHIDDLKCILNIRNFTALDLWYYIKDRDFYRDLRFPEINLFSFYYHNNCTFYLNCKDDSLLKLEVEYENIIRLKKISFSANDFHYINMEDSHYFVERSIDFSDELPLYTLHKQYDKNSFFCEYRKGSILASAKREAYNFSNREIAKSILIWSFAVESFTGKNLIEDNISLGVSIEDSGKWGLQPANVSNYKNVFHYIIPSSSLNNLPNDNFVDKTILLNLYSNLRKYGIHINVEYKSMIEYTFNNIRGHIIQGDDYQNPLLFLDDYNQMFVINKRCIDVILEDIAHSVLSNYKPGETLGMEESKKCAKDITNYLESRLYSLLIDIGGYGLFRKLLELHHSCQYWRELIHKRHEGVYGVMSGIGLKYEKQMEYANEYTETNNIVCYLLEFIVRHNITSDTFQVPSYDNLNLLFSLAEHIIKMGQYNDMLIKREEKACLSITQKGRFLIPNEEWERYYMYFYNLRYQGFFEMKKLRKKWEFFPEVETDKHSVTFNNAFKCEYGLDFDSLSAIIQKCIKYCVSNNKPIADFTIQEFRSMLLIGFDNATFETFMKNFVLSHYVAKDISDDIEFLPQRYNRKFQVSSRPWILYNDNIYFSFKSLIVSYRILLERIDQGTLRFTSKEMEECMKRIGNQKGKDFNHKMYNLYNIIPHSMVSVHQSVQIRKGAILNYDGENGTALGDIDLLLISPIKRKIICIELKNYAEDRDLWRFFTQGEKIKVKLQKVNDRDKWCKEHITDFKYYCKSVDSTYSLKTLFITCNAQAYSYLYENEYPNVTILDLTDIIDDPMSVFDY